MIQLHNWKWKMTYTQHIFIQYAERSEARKFYHFSVLRANFRPIFIFWGPGLGGAMAPLAPPLGAATGNSAIFQATASRSSPCKIICFLRLVWHVIESLRTRLITVKPGCIGAYKQVISVYPFSLWLFSHTVIIDLFLITQHNGFVGMAAQFIMGKMLTSNFIFNLVLVFLHVCIYNVSNNLYIWTVLYIIFIIHNM